MSKKTLETIVNSGNHYIVQVKANQKTLFEQIQLNTSEKNSYVNFFVEETRERGRIETRKIFLYKDLNGISEEWVGLRRLIRVERYVLSVKGERHETSYYMSDIGSNKALLFGKHIRCHWGIENRLHWVKDVVLGEDASKIIRCMAPENMSIIRNIICNTYRSHGFDSIKYATELFANNIKELLKLINSKTKIYKRT